MNPLQKQTCIAIVNIFESGSLTGNYGAVGGLKNDKGHLSYGRSQVSLMSGNLFLLIKAYCEAPDAQFAQELSPFLGRLGNKDITLDQDLTIRNVLRQTGNDPAMKRIQDDYFDRNFFQPALAAAQHANLQQPLSQTIAYDTHIQGGWQACSIAVNAAVGPIGANIPEETWITRYLEVRTEYLKRHAPQTTYRPEAFGKLVSAGTWALDLPIALRGLTITAHSFGTPAPEPSIPLPPIPDPEIDSLPLLRPLVPYMRGPDVLSVQKLLNNVGMKNSEDQIYGPFTQTLVSAFQKHMALKPDAIVGPQTWAALKTNQPAAAV